MKFEKPLRVVNCLGCRSGYGVALGEALARTGIPSVGFITCHEKSIFLGRQLRTTKVNVKKAEEDGITLRRQNCRGKIVMMHDCNELTITVGIGDYKKYAEKGKDLFKFFCDVVNLGSNFLGIGTKVATKAKFPKPVINQDCFAFIDKGDMCTIQNGRKISASTYIVRDNYFQFDTVINLTSRSNIAPYLESPEESFETTSIEQETGRLIILHEILMAYKEAFFHAVGTYEDPLTIKEKMAWYKLVESKYLNEDWIYSKWRQ